MRIAIGLYSLLAGGSEYQMMLLGDALRDRGHFVTFYLISAEKTDSMVNQFREFPVRHTNLRLMSGGRFRKLTASLQWRHWLRQDKITHAIAALFYPQFLLSVACLGTRVKLVVRRGCVWREYKHIAMYRNTIDMLAVAQRRFGWRVSKVVGNADEVRVGLVDDEGWPESKIVTIRNGWPEFPAIDWRNRTPWYSARPREEKQVDRATQEFACRGVPLALSFDPPDWSKVGILVHASPSDSCSNSIGMAMAHAIPVVAFDLPGNRELMGPSKEYLVPIGDYFQLCAEVAYLRGWAEERRQIGLDNQRRVRGLFGLRRMVDEWESLLRNL